MDTRFFISTVDALGKVVTGLKALANMPKAERNRIRATLDETCRPIDTTLNMVIIRLGEIQRISVDDDFLREAVRLDNYHDWLQAEREFRLCRSLRIALRETESLASQIAGSLSTNDWAALLGQMQAILATENEVAVFIGQRFQKLASDARGAGNDPKAIVELRESLAAMRAALVAERQALITHELELFKIV